jgi:hypothetical protein
MKPEAKEEKKVKPTKETNLKKTVNQLKQLLREHKKEYQKKHAPQSQEGQRKMREMKLK